MRQLSSCSTCRVRKKRCIPAASNDNCMFCASKQKACDLASAKAKGSGTRFCNLSQSRPTNSSSLSSNQWSTRYDLSPQQSQAEAILKLPVSDTLIDLYFDIFHNKQQIIFHRRLLADERKAAVLPNYLALGIIALTARFSTHKYFHALKPCERAGKYLSAALRSFNVRDKLVSLHSLQGCILLSFLCFTEGQSDQESLLAAQAIRMVQIMKLPDCSVESVLEREIQIRLFWQATMMDTWNSVRDRLPRQLLNKSAIPKPIKESIFESLSNNETRLDDMHPFEKQDYNIWTQVIELSETFAEVTELLTTVVNYPSLGLQIESKTKAITDKLDYWLRNLSLPLQNTPENFQIASRLGCGREFAVIHLIYHHQCQLLFFPYLSKYTPSFSDKQVSEYIHRCKAHARALSDLMWATNTKSGMECLWSPVNGHLLVVASTVLLHALIFDQDSQDISKTRRLLEQNFVMLLQFQEYWPTLQNALSRLQTFHQNFGPGFEQQNFRMDTWMLEFLLDYSNLLVRRPDMVEQSSTTCSGSYDIGLNWYEWTDKEFVRASNLNALLSFA